MLVGLVAAALPAAAADRSLAAAEQAFLDYLDANSAMGFIESGAVERFEQRDLDGWLGVARTQRLRLDEALTSVATAPLSDEEANAVAAMRRTLATLAVEDGDATLPNCGDAGRRDADYAVMRAALASCFL